MDIVEELRTNRESGAKRLEIEYKAGLMTLAKRFHADESDAEELVNRTFAAVVNGIDGYLARSAFFTWMCQILVNLHANDTRRKANGAVVYPGTIPDVADESSQEAVYSAMDASMLRDAIETLPEEMRKTLLLHYFMDMPVKDIARFLAIPSGTVLWRLHYARQMLAAKLGVVRQKPGGKAILLALALAALTAVGAVGVAAIRYAAGQGAEETAVVSNAEGAEGSSTESTGLTGFEEAGAMPQATNQESPPPAPEANGGGTGQAGARAAVSNSNNEENTMNIQSIKSAAVKTLAAGAMLAATAYGETVCYFDGDTYISMGKSFPLADSVSLSAWVRVDPKITILKPFLGGYYGAGIAGQGYWGVATGLGFFARGVESANTSNHCIREQVRNSGTCIEDAYYDTALFTAGEWHHYLLVRDKENGKARFYVDGTLVSDKAFDGTLSISPSHNFAIGKNMAGMGGCFCGYIAEVALWDVALTDKDAAALSFIGMNGVSTAPYAYFPLNEGEGNSVTGTDNGSSLTRSASGTLSWVDDPTFSRGKQKDGFCAIALVDVSTNSANVVWTFEPALEPAPSVSARFISGFEPDLSDGVVRALGTFPANGVVTSAVSFARSFTTKTYWRLEAQDSAGDSHATVIKVIPAFEGMSDASTASLQVEFDGLGASVREEYGYWPVPGETLSLRAAHLVPNGDGQSVCVGWTLYAETGENICTAEASGTTCEASYVPDGRRHRLVWHTARSQDIQQNLPEGFVRLGSIVAHGQQMIDTGYYPNYKTHLAVDLRFDGSYDNSDKSALVPFGAPKSAENFQFSFNFGGMATEGTTLYLWTCTSASGIRKLSATDDIVKNRNVVEVNMEDGWAAYGGVTNNAIATRTSEQPQTTTLRLFGESVPFTGYPTMAIYGAKISDGTTSQRDLVPALSAATGRLGLYDLVGGGFYTNIVAGADDFAVEGIIVEGEPSRIGEPTIPYGYSGMEPGTVFELAEPNKVRTDAGPMRVKSISRYSFDDVTGEWTLVERTRGTGVTAIFTGAPVKYVLNWRPDGGLLIFVR